jgi:Uma2 family endonuclease
MARSPEDDPFFYGARWTTVRLPDGTIVDRIPLTLDDLLDPQLDDEIPQSTQHFRLTLDLFDLLERYFASREDVKVVSDMKMLWGIPGLPGPSPDVAVIPEVWSDDEDWESFDVQRKGTRPCLIIEVVSSLDMETRRLDYEKKVLVYEQAGIPEYLIYDPPSSYTQGRLLLTGYQLGADGHYGRIEPDTCGLLHSETIGLLFGVAEDGRKPLVIKEVPGKRLLTGKEAAKKARERAQAAEERARAAEGRAQSESEARKVTEAELARLRAELERLKNS